MIQVGKINILKIIRITAIGAYLNDDDKGILLPARYLNIDAKVDDEIAAFIYHDNEGRLIATTDTPIAMVGDIAELEITGATEHGVFLNNGIMKDIFMHVSNIPTKVYIGDKVWVAIYLDRTRIAATMHLDKYVSNDELKVEEKEVVELIVYRKTQIGFVTIINKTNIGLLHLNDVFTDIVIGKMYNGFIKKITTIEDITKIDVAIGKMGYDRVEDESDKILRLLNENKGTLPYNDKSNPEDIYNYFGMSKKTFKMALGKLYKAREIIITNDGIKGK